MGDRSSWPKTKDARIMHYEATQGENRGDHPIIIGASGVLAGQEIQRLNLVEPFDHKCLRAASYDLKLGGQVLICGQGRPKIENLKNGQHVTIKSFGRIIFVTSETILLGEHDDIVGRFDLMIRYGLDGLILQVGTQVEPGYDGPLFGLLINTQGHEKTLEVGERLLTIEFSRLNRKPDGELLKGKRDKIKNLKEFLKSQNIHLDRLSEPSVIDKVKDELKDCQQRHGLRRAILDSKYARKAVKWAIIMAFIALTTFLLAYPHKVADYVSRIKQGAKILFTPGSVSQESKDKQLIGSQQDQVSTDVNDQANY